MEAVVFRISEEQVRRGGMRGSVGQQDGSDGMGQL